MPSQAIDGNHSYPIVHWSGATPTIVANRSEFLGFRGEKKSIVHNHFLATALMRSRISGSCGGSKRASNSNEDSGLISLPMPMRFIN